MLVKPEEFVRRVREYEDAVKVRDDTHDGWACSKAITRVSHCIENGESIVFEGKTYCVVGFEEDSELVINTATEVK